MVASTVGRLYSSAFYALRDTRTPLRFAVVRVALTTVLGGFCALPPHLPLLPRILGIDARWCVAGLTASAGFAAWVEFLLLRGGMNRRIGRMDFPLGYFARLWAAGGISAALAWGMRLGLRSQHPIVSAVLILVPYGAAYLALTAMMGIDEAAAVARRLLRMFRPSRQG